MDQDVFILLNDEPDEACTALIEAANSAGGYDNTTVVVGKFTGDAGRRRKIGTDTTEMKPPSAWTRMVRSIFRQAHRG